MKHLIMTALVSSQLLATGCMMGEELEFEEVAELEAEDRQVANYTMTCYREDGTTWSASGSDVRGMIRSCLEGDGVDARVNQY